MKLNSLKIIAVIVFFVPFIFTNCAVDTGIKIENISSQHVENLYKVGKIWGFLKYYHPEIKKGKFNWDDELIKILPEVINKTDADELNSYLNKWIQSIGEISRGELVPPGVNIKLSPDVEWINDIDFWGDELSETLSKVKNAEKFPVNYYIEMAPNVGNPIFKNEVAYEDMEYDDDGLKLVGLFRYWNMIEYYFPYRNLIEDNWDSVLKEFITRIITADDKLSYTLTLIQLVGKINDTHAGIWSKDDVLSKYWGMNSPPVEVTIMDGRVIIVKILDKSVETEGLKIGDEIIEINDTSVERLISEKIDYCPASNFPTKLREVSYRLLRTNEDSIKFTVNNGITNSEIKLKCNRFDPSIYWKDDKSPSKILEGNIGYIYPGSLQKGQIDGIMQGLISTNGLIVDMRCYPSDFIVFSLTKYLMPNPKAFVKFTQGSLIKPGEFSFSQTLSVGEYKNDYYKGKIVIIVNEKTQSQSEYTTMALKAAPNTIVVGCTTAGADGNVSSIILPGNVGTSISGIGVYYPDGTETQCVGIIPDIEIKPTIEGIRKGEDELLNKAVDIINGE